MMLLQTLGSCLRLYEIRTWDDDVWWWWWWWCCRLWVHVWDLSGHEPGMMMMLQTFGSCLRAHHTETWDDNAWWWWWRCCRLWVHVWELTTQKPGMMMFDDDDDDDDVLQTLGSCLRARRAGTWAGSQTSSWRRRCSRWWAAQWTLPPSSGSWSSACRATWLSGEWPGAGSSYSAVTTLFFLIITGCGACFWSKGDCDIALWFLVCVAHRKGTEGHWGGCRSTDSEEMRKSLEPPHPGLGPHTAAYTPAVRTRLGSGVWCHHRSTLPVPEFSDFQKDIRCLGWSGVWCHHAPLSHYESSQTSWRTSDVWVDQEFDVIMLHSPTTRVLRLPERHPMSGWIRSLMSSCSTLPLREFSDFQKDIRCLGWSGVWCHHAPLSHYESSQTSRRTSDVWVDQEFDVIMLHSPSTRVLRLPEGHPMSGLIRSLMSSCSTLPVPEFSDFQKDIRCLGWSGVWCHHAPLSHYESSQTSRRTSDVWVDQEFDVIMLHSPSTRVLRLPEGHPMSGLIRSLMSSCSTLPVPEFSDFQKDIRCLGWSGVWCHHAPLSHYESSQTSRRTSDVWVDQEFDVIMLHSPSTRVLRLPEGHPMSGLIRSLMSSCSTLPLREFSDFQKDIRCLGWSGVWCHHAPLSQYESSQTSRRTSDVWVDQEFDVIMLHSPSTRVLRLPEGHPMSGLIRSLMSSCSTLPLREFSDFQKDIRCLGWSGVWCHHAPLSHYESSQTSRKTSSGWIRNLMSSSLQS